MLSLLALALGLFAGVNAQDTDIQTIETTLKASHVIPDVLPANFTPRFPIEVAFIQSDNKTVLPVTAGANFTMEETANIPGFAILSNNTQIIGKPYLIAMVDPDAPSPPNRTRAQILHFLGVNYISNNITDGTLFILANTSAPLMPFMGPTPPNGSIPHRYVIAMYLQNSTNVTAAPGTIPQDRVNFNLTRFVDETGNLTLLGATFFFVGPGNSTANNTVTGNPSVGSILATATAPGAPAASGANGTGGALSLEVVVPAVWSTLAVLFGAVAYFM